MSPTLKKTVFNFNGGPAMLPASVMEKAQADLLNFGGTGMSVMEISHRSKEFVAVVEKAEASLRSLYKISNDYEVLFLQGGASLQFAMVPLNLYQSNHPIDVVHTGYWTKKAIQELEKIAPFQIVASSEADGFKKIPSIDSAKINKEASYFYLTSNNTIYGSQWKSYPDTGNVPLVADMTSDLLSRELDISKFGLIFAGAQKNVGPAGVAVVVIRKDLAERAAKEIPTMLQYRTHIKGKSLYNTPPTFGIYMAGLVFEWVESQGGIKAVEKDVRKKADLIYGALDKSSFYQGVVEKDSRSLMNATFRIKDGNEELESKFVKEAKENGFIGLKGHRSVGGLRASIYIAQPVEGVQALVQFMSEFEKQNG